jgi:hypothetical protein
MPSVAPGTIRRQLCPKLPTPLAQLGVLRQELFDKVSRGVLKHHHDLQQFQQLIVESLPSKTTLIPN